MQMTDMATKLPFAPSVYVVVSRTFLSLTISAILCSRADLFTWYGISVTTTAFLFGLPLASITCRNTIPKAVKTRSRLNLLRVACAHGL